MGLRKKIQVMISSRCKTLIEKADGSTCQLSSLREELKRVIEAELLFGNELFQVWISEDPQAPDAINTVWDECIARVKECHFLIFLYTKEAGWSASGDIGICHKELETGISLEPGKVFIIDISGALKGEPDLDNAEKARNKLMVDYVEGTRKSYESASKYEKIIEKTQNVVAEAVARFVDYGKREAGRGKYNSGEALDWSRMNYGERKHIIEQTMVNHLIKSEGGKIENRGHENLVTLNLGGQNIVFICHGIPAGMGVATAREMVGQPFLKDHIYLKNQSDRCYGPIHLIGVHKGVNESQAIKQLGFPDAIVVNAPFGVYVADKVNKIQMIFLANCRDDTSTRFNVQRFLDWIIETGENEFIRKRCISRRKIVNLIQKEIE
ncbi:MAG: hypothetical protein ACYC6G_14330 [Desulfobaccales bacterium]